MEKKPYITERVYVETPVDTDGDGGLFESFRGTDPLISKRLCSGITFNTWRFCTVTR